VHLIAEATVHVIDESNGWESLAQQFIAYSGLSTVGVPIVEAWARGASQFPFGGTRTRRSSKAPASASAYDDEGGNHYYEATKPRGWIDPS
jgi:hypothetical protein